MLYKTFAEGNQQFGRRLTNQNFLMATGELLRWLESDLQHTWRVLAFEGGYVGQPKPAIVQRICAVKGTADTPVGLQLD